MSLHPIPVTGEPFEHVLTDCAGPLPRTKSGSQYLLTVMCAAITAVITPVALLYLLAYVLSSLAVDELGSADGSEAVFHIIFPNSSTMLLPYIGLTSAGLASADYPGCSALRQHELLHWTEMQQFQSIFTCRPARPTKSAGLWLILLLFLSGNIHPNSGPELIELMNPDDLKNSGGLH